MTRLFLTFITLAVLKTSGQTPDNTPAGYTINADIKGLKSTVVYMIFSDPLKPDSATVKEGHFTFKGSVEEPMMATIYDGHGKMELLFFIEDKKIHISGGMDSPDHAVIEGSATQEEYEAYQLSIKGLDAQQRKTLDRAYILAHPSSPISLMQILSASRDFGETEKFFASMDRVQQNSLAGRKLAKDMVMIKRTAIGQPALDFTQNDLQGRPVRLSQYRGKYVLVDFWASWCGPCRAENPNVLKAYNQFKDKQFDVLGVSMDNDSTKWREAVQKDGMPWTQVCDLKGVGESETARQYNIAGLPSNFLIDPNGIIIAKNLRGDQLQKKLSEVLSSAAAR